MEKRALEQMHCEQMTRFFNNHVVSITPLWNDADTDRFADHYVVNFLDDAGTEKRIEAQKLDDALSYALANFADSLGGIKL